MRTHGTLTKWNDDRGFGFISPAGGGDELFVHISAFPRDGRRPMPGEIVSYEVEAGSDGKTRAVKIMRPGRKATARTERHRNESKSANVAQVAIAVLLIGFLAGYAWKRLKPQSATPTAATTATIAESTGDSPFKCDGRTMCSQMTSCEEARYFVRHCPDTKMDGNNDGEPCEQQWCNAD